MIDRWKEFFLRFGRRVSLLLMAKQIDVIFALKKTS